MLVPAFGILIVTALLIDGLFVLAKQGARLSPVGLAITVVACSLWPLFVVDNALDIAGIKRPAGIELAAATEAVLVFAWFTIFLAVPRVIVKDTRVGPASWGIRRLPRRQ